jgi:hypothetical protein
VTAKTKIVIACTDLSIKPAEVARLYSLRFNIEESFKKPRHTVFGLS